MPHLEPLVEELLDRSIGLRSLQDCAVDAVRASGEMMFSIFLIMTRFQKGTIQEHN